MLLLAKPLSCRLFAYHAISIPLVPKLGSSSLRYFSKYAGSPGSFFSIPVVIGSFVLSSVISFQAMFGPNVAWRLIRPYRLYLGKNRAEAIHDWLCIGCRGCYP